MQVARDGFRGPLPGASMSTRCDKPCLAQQSMNPHPGCFSCTLLFPGATVTLIGAKVRWSAGAPKVPFKDRRLSGALKARFQCLPSDFAFREPRAPCLLAQCVGEILAKPDGQGFTHRIDRNTSRHGATQAVERAMAAAAMAIPNNYPGVSAFLIVRLTQRARGARSADEAREDHHGDDVGNDLNVFHANVRDHTLHLNGCGFGEAKQ